MSLAVSFDRCLLPPADLEFAVVADTHYMLDPGDGAVEFESRRRQSDRARLAWEAIARLDPAFVVHMGDLVQEFPGRAGFEQAQAEALAQIDDAGLRDRCHFVAGNHDVGDKPDPTMPTEDVTDASMAAWHDLFGPSWTRWDAGGIRFLVLNSQILNTGLPAEAQQRIWLEAQSREAWPGPTVAFLHLPVYLGEPHEAALGHYDNIAPPARGWLLEQFAALSVVDLFAAHVHWRFVHALPGGGRYWLTPSTSFTRPGFGHLFTAAAAPERGRDDVPKTGFLWVRVVSGDDGDPRLDVHLVRTDDLAAGGTTLMPPLPRANRGRLGASSPHVLAPAVRVPVAYPSAVRQPVRNDYPLLACLEMGARRLRLPIEDLADPTQAERVEVLRREGVRPQWTALGVDALRAGLAHLRDGDIVELQVPGTRQPPSGLLDEIPSTCAKALCPVLPGEVVPGKQHPRTRIGYRPGELADLDIAADVELVVRLDGASPWDDVDALRQVDRPLCLLAELPGVDQWRAAQAAACSVVAAATLGAILLLEPLVDLDRTMDVSHGLLDGLCNPRPAFHTARHLAALLAEAPCEAIVEEDGVDLGAGRRLVFPRAGERPALPTTARIGRLRDGTWWTASDLPEIDDAMGPLLLIPA
jgi:predicted phosphodiesterase